MRRFVSRSSSYRVVYFAVTVPDLFYGGVRARVFCRRILVWAWREATETEFKLGQAAENQCVA